jgi:hypothetical protein
MGTLGAVSADNIGYGGSVCVREGFNGVLY